jgi:branched-chain amino acid transport system substrate-binding protein
VRTAYLVVVAGTLAASCASILDVRESRYLVEAGAGRCEGTVVVRGLFDLTGPSSDVSKQAYKGAFDYVRELDERGGLRGCHVDMSIDDSEYDPQKALAIYGRWRTEPDFARVSTIFIAGVPIIQPLAPLAAADEKIFVTGSVAGEFGSPVAVTHDLKIPTLNGSFSLGEVPVSKRSPGYPSAFFAATDYTTIARIAMQHAWKQGAKRVGFFACSTTSFCTDPVDGAKSFLTNLGGTQIGRDLVVELADSGPGVEQNVLAFFQAELAQKKRDPSYTVVDWLWFGNTHTSLAFVGKALARVRTELGLDVHVVTQTWGVDEDLYAVCGDACAGFLGVQPLPIYGDGSIASMGELMRVHDKYRAVDGDPQPLYRTVSYVAGYVIAALWERAANKVIDAQNPLTGSNLRDALEGMQNVDLDGFANVSFSPTDHRPQSSARIYKLAPGGALQSVGPPIAVPLAPDGVGW